MTTSSTYSTRRSRLEEPFDLIRREYDLLLKENSMLRQQREDTEARMTQQLNELDAMHAAIAHLENTHIQLKRDYERQLHDLQGKLLRHASPPSPTANSPGHSKSHPIPVPTSVPHSALSAPGIKTAPRLMEGGIMDVDGPVLPPISPGDGLRTRTPPNTNPRLSPGSLTRQASPQYLPKATPGWKWKGIDIPSIPAQVRGGDLSSDWVTVYQDPEWKQQLDIQPMQTFIHPSVVCCVRFSPDGKHLATGCNKSAQIFEVGTGYKVCELKDDSSSKDLYVRSVAFSPDGKYLATGTEDNLVRVWDIAKKRVRSKFSGHESEIYALQFSRDGRSVVSASGDGSVRIWDMLDSSCRVLQNSPEDESPRSPEMTPSDDLGITSVSLSPSGGLIAAGSLDNTIKIWDATTCTLIETLRGHTSSVYNVAFLKDGNGLVSGSLDKTMRYWDVSQLVGGGIRSPSVEESRSKVIYNGHVDFVLSVGVTNKSNWVVSGSKDRSVMFWDTQTGQALALLQGHKNSVIQVDVNASSTLIATGSGDHTARIWRVNLP